jgi:hypothetical protein
MNGGAQDSFAAVAACRRLFFEAVVKSTGIRIIRVLRRVEQIRSLPWGKTPHEVRISKFAKVPSQWVNRGRRARPELNSFDFNGRTCNH